MVLFLSICNIDNFKWCSQNSECMYGLSTMREQKCKQLYSLACKSTLHYIESVFWTQRSAGEVCIESVHCREEGCIGKYTPRGPRDFPRAGILHPEAREIARGRSPRAISRAEGCKIPAQGKSRGPRGVYFPIHPDSRQCTDILSSLSGNYWFCCLTTDGASIRKAY